METSSIHLPRISNVFLNCGRWIKVLLPILKCPEIESLCRKKHNFQFSLLDFLFWELNFSQELASWLYTESLLGQCREIGQPMRALGSSLETTAGQPRLLEYEKSPIFHYGCLSGSTFRLWNYIEVQRKSTLTPLCIQLWKLSPLKATLSMLLFLKSVFEITLCAQNPFVLIIFANVKLWKCINVSPTLA